MDDLEESKELERLRADSIALEEEAELSTIMEQAREGRFIPLGAFGEKTTPQEYFADEYDHLRGDTRDAYFSTENKDLRMKLICAQRKIESHLRQLLETDNTRANAEFATAKNNAQKLPWSKAALIAIGAVILGYWVYDIVGAIAGAVGGFFLGLGIIWQQRNESKLFFLQAAQDLEEAKKEQSENACMPEFFSHREEITGERDTNVDDESAYANLCQKESG